MSSVHCDIILAASFASANCTSCLLMVSGDYAFQWGTYHYGMRPRTGGDTVRTSGKLMRILQRQPDGTWKIHRGISSVDPPSP